MTMTRSEFLYSLLAAPLALAGGAKPFLGNGSEGNASFFNASSDTRQAAMPVISPMLFGSIRTDTNREAWFKSMSAWGVRQWMTYPFPYHLRYEADNARIVPFIGNLLPEFRPYLDRNKLQPQEELILHQAKLCSDLNLEFWYILPFPLFPTRDRNEVEKAVPYLFSSGKLNLYDRRLAEILKSEVRSVKKAIPSLQGINIWFAEGDGGLVEFTPYDLEHTKEWQRPLIKAFDEVTKELEIQGIVFAHNYRLTVGTRRNIYSTMADFPRLGIMEDITWPEEDMQHPFLGYLPEGDKKLLFHTNPVDLDFLLDTEYIGQGVLPSVYPRWWKQNIDDAVRSGAKIAMGRTFFWDGGYTDITFNRLNVYIFTRLCYEPGIDSRQLLGDAAREMFGEKIPEQLIDILWETEPVLKKLIAINGVDILDHSSFPSPEDIDVIYMKTDTRMKAIDDLFQQPGTVLYPKLTDGLNNAKQWRWQNHTISMSGETYIAEKQEAVAWLSRILPQVERLAASLTPQHRKLFVNGYQLAAILAQGMELVVETAFVHYQWAHAKTFDDEAARAKFDSLASRFRSLAKNVPDNPFLYQERMREFANFLQRGIPSLSREQK